MTRVTEHEQNSAIWISDFGIWESENCMHPFQRASGIVLRTEKLHICALCCSRTDPAVSKSLPLFDLVLAARQLIDCRLGMVINIVGYGLDGSVKV